tara:strand:- start:1018 stop:1365 length:348 start_codon:yes stop_codon:yes gene_type:complete
MSVYVSNLVINQGATFTQKFELENVTSNSALELSGFTVFSKMRKHATSLTTAATFTCSVADAAAGVIQVGLTSTTTAGISPGRYQYDVIVKDNAGEVTRVVEGSVLVRAACTRED